MNKNSRPWTVNQVKKMIDNQSLVFDNAIQRNFVWDRKRMSLLIDSLIRDYPVPPFYTILDGRKITTPKGEVSVYDCLDGKQRCTTLYRFLNDEFTLSELEPFATEEGNVDISGMKYSELPEELQDTLKNAHITVYSFDDATDDDITEIMARLNNGKPLSAVDNTRIKAKDLKGIQRLASHKFFANYLTDKAIEGHQGEEIVVKIYHHINNPESGLDNKDIRPVYQSLEITAEVEVRMNIILDNLFDIIMLVEKYSKKLAKKLCKKTHLISISFMMDRVMTEDDKASIAKCLIQFFDEGSPSYDEDYNSACQNGSNHAENVKARRNALQKHIDWYYRKDTGEEENNDEDIQE
jgi:uncharacterized protein with ParB-like and HNH nuclease domain